jgi:thiol-disulfide isomerase/thioredoxin
MKSSLFFAVAFCCAAYSALAQGISFEKGDWFSTLVKAKAQKRLVYVDVYADWCGPCKLLEKLVFPKKEAGDFYNAHFVNAHVNAEKGEGIGLVKRYQVTAFPTHIFIDPASEQVVYWTTGYGGLETFLEEGETAVAEWKDPMTWEKYEAAFPAKKNDRKFLRDWLRKADRLHKDNNEILNAYAALLNKQHPGDSEINFLAESIRTLDNDAVALVDAHKAAVKGDSVGEKDYLTYLHERWSYATLEKAIHDKNETMLATIEASFRKAEPADADEKMFYILKRYYAETGDNARAFQESAREADFISRKSMAAFLRDDSMNLGAVREQMRFQLKAQGVTEEQMEQQIAANLHLNPTLRHNVSVQAATTLNSLAWTVYEQHTQDTALLRRALAWSERSLELSEFSPNDWAPFADTYAHLLYRNHAPREAISLQQKVVDKLRTTGRPPTDVASYESELEKMKSGTL